MLTLFRPTDPFAELDQLRIDMDRLFRDFADDRSDGFPVVSPAIAVEDEGKTLVLRAELPGVTEDDLTIDATESSLTVRGARTTQTPQGHDTHRKERRSFQFARSFALPCRIDLERTKATLRDGVLTVSLEKKPEAQPKAINVETG